MSSKLQNGVHVAAAVAGLALEGPAAQTLVPAGALDAVAAAAGVAPDALTTLEIPCSAGNPYAAVLEYAALVSPAPGGPPAGKRPLYLNPADCYEPASDSDSDGEEEREYGSDGEGGVLLLDDGGGVRGGGGQRKKRVPKPKAVFGTGVIEVCWPPPVGTVVGSRGAGKVVAEGDAEVSEYGVDKGSLWVVHTAVGGPVPNQECGVSVYRTVAVFSARGESALEEFVAGVVKWRADRDHVPGRVGRFCLYRFKMDPDGGVGGFWSHEGLKRARPMESVVLPEGRLEEIMADVRQFLEPDTKRWYVKHGLPHRRCLLLEGPPGTGKTSCTNAIASTFNMNCCFLSTTCKSFSNQTMGDALAQIPENALLVLEDVDSLFNEDRKNEDGSLTFSGMLNALDGFLSTDGVLTVMTTNHADRLDAALTRGGRVDRRFNFAKPVPSQIAALFRTFYPDAASGLAEEFARIVFGRPEGDAARSIATLQQLFIAQRRASPEECIACVPAFFEMYFPNGSGAKNTLYT